MGSRFKKAVKPKRLHGGLSAKLRYELQVVKRRGCWRWRGGKDKDGYGRIRVGGQQRKAHQFAYEYYVGPIPDGHVIRHLCHNPECTNPLHLTTGTVQENVQDSLDAGRAFVGELNGRAKLDEEQVREIVRLWQTGRYSKSELSRMFPVNDSMIGRIVRGEAWTHITKEIIDVS